MMSIEKVYDELYGMIEDLKRQIAAGGGGSDVTITPALESGTKVADYEIDGEAGVLYAPTIPPIPTVVAPFVDTNTEHRITNGSFQNEQMSYTATQDCVVLVNIANVVLNTYTAIKIDDLAVWTYSGAAIATSFMFFVKAGQVVTTVGAGSSTYNSYNVYPLLEATAPTTRSKKK